MFLFSPLKYHFGIKKRFFKSNLVKYENKNSLLENFKF